MKSSLGKLRRLALHKNDGKEKREFQPSAHLDELAQAAQVLTFQTTLQLELCHIHNGIQFQTIFFS